MEPVTLPEVARLISIYKAGRYREIPKWIRHCRTTELTVHCEKSSVINMDGEARFGRDVTFRVEPQALRFFYPQGLTYSAAVKTEVPV